MRVFKSLSSIFAALIVAFTFTTGAGAQEYKKITRLGTSEAVCPGGVETKEQLQAFFAENPNAVRQIMADAGWSGDTDALMQAVANGELNERAYPVGTQMQFMGAKKNGQFVANPYREWAGTQSFEAFQVNVSDGCEIHEIVIPKVCCNVSLVSVTPSTEPECTGAISTVKEEEPVAVAPVAEQPEPTADPLALVPFIGVFAGTETRPRFETAWEMFKRDSSGIVGLRAGLMKGLSDKTNILGQVSYYDRSGINGGNEYPEDNFAIDIGVERMLSERAFIGGGIGAWNVDDSDFRDTSIYGIVGGGFGESNLQWFLEGRVFDSDVDGLDSISDNKMFSAGLRYLIK